jgi:hypothetical protein
MRNPPPSGHRLTLVRQPTTLVVIHPDRGDLRLPDPDCLATGTGFGKNNQMIDASAGKSCASASRRCRNEDTGGPGLRSQIFEEQMTCTGGGPKSGKKIQIWKIFFEIRCPAVRISRFAIVGLRVGVMKWRVGSRQLSVADLSVVRGQWSVVSCCGRRAASAASEHRQRTPVTTAPAAAPS